MRTPSGILHVVDFKTSQIVSNIQPKDYWDDKRHWEIKNNIDTLEFKVFDNTEDAATLIQQNLVLKEVRDGRIVPYVITETEKDSNDRSVIAYASGEWIQLAKAGIITPQKVEGKTVNEFIDMALVGTKWKRGRTEYAGFHTMTIDEFISPLKLLKDIASLFELEIQYRAEVVGSQIVSRYVDMVKKRGHEIGKEVTLGKDLVGIKRVENSQNICTALLGFSKKEGEGFITITDINDGIPYLVDSDAFQRWNERGQHKFGFYTPETEGDITPKRLMTLMKTELAKRINSSISYDVQAQSIGRVFGLSHELINEGDTIRIKDTGFTPKLYLEARAIAGDESFTDPSQDKYVFGDYREITDPNEEMRKLYNRVLASLGNKANKELLEQLEKLAEEAKGTAEQAQKESESAKKLAEKVQENLKNNTVNIIEAKNPPIDNLIVGKTLWRDISNGKPGILKVWNGKDWELLIPDVESVKEETLKQVNKDIQLTKEELNKKVEEAQSETNGQFKEVKNSLQEVSQTIKNVQNSQGEINKTVSEIKQTNEGFTKSIESLTKKDGEITEKLNTVEDTVEGTKQTIADVKQTTNVLTKTTNEIKNTATSNKQTIEQLQTDMSNISVGSINLASDSETGLNKQNMNGTWSDSKQMTLSNKINYRNKTFTISFLFTGKMTKLNANPWFGVETAITYTDGEQEWKSVRADSQLKINVDYKDEPLTVTFKTKDKDVTQIRFYYSGRNIDGNLNSHHAKLEEGNIRTTWQPANDEVTSKETFTKKTTEIEKSVDGIKESIKTVEKTQTSFNERVSTVEKNAEGTTTSVKKLQETQTNQGKTLSEATTTIGQHSEALKLTMKKKDVEDYVGGLGSINDLRNASFAQGFKYWSQNGNSAVIESSVTYRGYTTAKLHVAGLNEDKWYSLHQTIDVTAGEDIVASGYFMSNNIGQGFVLEIEYLNAQGSRVSQSSIGIDVTANANWIRAVISGTVPAGAVKARYKPWVRRNGTLWIALPMLQRGKVATEFWLHPKDQTDVDKMMEDIANKVATEKYNQKVTELERSISATEKGVSIISGKQETFINETYNAYVKKTESKLEVLDEGILAQILKDGIVTAINMSPGKITINAAKLDINADTMVKWLTAKGIDTNLIRINGDKITIDKNGVTVKMLDFLYEDERGMKTTVMSKRNLISDHDFSSAIKKDIGNPDYWGFDGGYGLPWRANGNVVIEKNTASFNYEQMVNAARVDMYNYPETTVKNGIHPGNIYTLSAHFRCAMINGKRVTAKPQLHICYVTYRDNVHYDIWYESKLSFDAPSTYYGDIQRRSFTFTIPASYKPQEHAVVIKVESADANIGQGTAVCVSGVTLVSGKYASMYDWDRAAAERADGLQPFNKIAIGDANTNIGIAPDGYTLDISTNKEVKFYTNIRALQGVSLGGNAFQQWGHIRFADGNLGPGFYVNSPNGWKFNALG